MWGSVTIPHPQPIAEPTHSATTDVPVKEELRTQDHNDGKGHLDSDFERLLDDVLAKPGAAAAATDNQTPPSEAALGSVEVTAASLPSPQPEYDAGSLSSVHMGLNLVYYGVLCAVIGFSVVLLAIAANWNRFFDLADALLFVVAPILLNAGVLLGLIGRFMCLSAPRELKGAWAIYAAVACDIGAILASVGYLADMLPGIFMLLGSIGFFLFAFFLKKLATHIRDNVSERRAGILFKVFTLLVVLAVLLVAGVFLLPEDKAFELLTITLVAAIGVLMFVSVLTTVILYVMLLSSLRTSLRTAETFADITQKRE